ncbi:BBT_HP_G0054540.mRNA.1.CDS.1 [Saccharomyces cerevisiae]|nr:BBT_HP_G0054540.mRNA.1.CDS.1 [Saccharomyces cerevisiae]CAI6703235.1 BBT_HP_G0054540.mRNA.1.CDS.1 [Saccharomyces cerevisiae]
MLIRMISPPFFFIPLKTQLKTFSGGSLTFFSILFFISFSPTYLLPFQNLVDSCGFLKSSIFIIIGWKLCNKFFSCFALNLYWWLFLQSYFTFGPFTVHKCSWFFHLLLSLSVYNFA